MSTLAESILPVLLEAHSTLALGQGALISTDDPNRFTSFFFQLQSRLRDREPWLSLYTCFPSETEPDKVVMVRTSEWMNKQPDEPPSTLAELEDEEE